MPKLFSECVKSLRESSNVVKEAFGELPPNILVLKRQSIRHFPDNTLVALYHNQKLNQFFSIPFGGTIRSTITPTTVREETEQLDEINLGKGDHDVIKSFLNKKPHSSKKLSTDGKKLDGHWLGGSGISHHSEQGVHLNELGSRSAQQVHRAIKKHNSLESHSDVPHHKIVNEEVIDESTLGTSEWEVHMNGKPTGTVERNFEHAKRYWGARSKSNPHGHKYTLVPKKTEKFSGVKDFHIKGHLEEGVIEENAIEQLKLIKAFNATHIHHKDKKKTRIDPTTAHALLTVHDALSAENQKKFRDHLEHSGERLKKMVDFSWKSVK